MNWLIKMELVTFWKLKHKTNQAFGNLTTQILAGTNVRTHRELHCLSEEEWETIIDFGIKRILSAFSIGRCTLHGTGIFELISRYLKVIMPTQNEPSHPSNFWCRDVASLALDGTILVSSPPDICLARLFVRFSDNLLFKSPMGYRKN